MRIVIADPGGDDARSAAAARRWRPYGPIDHVELDDVPAVQVDPRAPMSVRTARETLAHWSAWEHVAAGSAGALVVDVAATPLVEPDELAMALSGLDQLDEPVIVGEHARAYVLSPGLAAALADVAPLDRLPSLELALARLDAAVFDDLLVGWVHTLDRSPLVISHVHVVELAALDLDGYRDDDLVIALDPARAELVATPAEVALALGDRNAVTGEGVAVGFVDALRRGETCADRSGVAADARAPWLLGLNGRVLDVAAERPVPILIGPARERASLLADRGSRDLARVLRYDDAVAAGDAMREVGAEIVVTPMWTPDFCATVIRAAEAAEAWGLDPDDPVPGREISLATISPRLFDHLGRDLRERIFPRLRTRWPYIDDAGLRDCFVIKYVPGAQGLRMHHDVAQLSGSVRLNDGYEGGELAFSRQGVDNTTTRVGELLVWPSLVTHPHAAAPVRRGVKYNLTIWWNIPASG